MTAKVLQNFRNTKILNEKSKNFFERRIFKEYNATTDATKKRQLVILAGKLHLHKPFDDMPITIENGRVLFGGEPFEHLTPEQKENFNFKLKLLNIAYENAN